MLFLMRMRRLARISHADPPSGGVFFRISASQNPFSLKSEL